MNKFHKPPEREPWTYHYICDTEDTEPWCGLEQTADEDDLCNFWWSDGDRCTSYVAIKCRNCGRIRTICWMFEPSLKERNLHTLNIPLAPITGLPPESHCSLSRRERRQYFGLRGLWYSIRTSIAFKLIAWLSLIVTISSVITYFICLNRK